MDDVAAAEPEDDGDRDRRQEEQAGQVVALDARLPQHAVAHRARLPAEARAHVVLAAESLHHLDPDDGLVSRLGHVAPSAAAPAARPASPCARTPGQQADERHRDQRVERQLGFTSTSTTATPMIIITTARPGPCPSR